jgi:hypothetical protein
MHLWNESPKRLGEVQAGDSSSSVKCSDSDRVAALTPGTTTPTPNNNSTKYIIL